MKLYSAAKRTAFALALIAPGFGALTAPGHAAGISPAEAGARYGQALAIAKFCPGGKLAAKADALPGSYTGADAETFKKEAANVTLAWDKTFDCVEIDPDTRRTTQCRKMRLTSCRQGWLEIGPEGRDMRGLVDVDFGAWAEKHPPPD